MNGIPIINVASFPWKMSSSKFRYSFWSAVKRTFFCKLILEKNCAVVDDLSMAYPFGINPKIDTPKFLLIAAPYEIAVPTTT